MSQPQMAQNNMRLQQNQQQLAQGTMGIPGIGGGSFNGMLQQ